MRITNNDGIKIKGYCSFSYNKYTVVICTDAESTPVCVFDEESNHAPMQHFDTVQEALDWINLNPL